MRKDVALDALSASIGRVLSPAPAPPARDIPDVPDGLDPDLKKLLDSLRTAVQEFAGYRGDPNNAAVRRGDLIAKGFADTYLNPVATAGAGAPGVAGPPGIAGPPATPDPTPPPSVTGLTASAGLTSVIVQWTVATYSQGHGPRQTNIYAAKKAAADPTLPTFTDAVLVEAAPHALTIIDVASDLSIRWHIWAKFESVDGYESASPAGGTNGVVAQTGQIGSTDLGPLIVLAGNLASGAVTATKVAAGAIDSFTKFAGGIEPVGIVSSLPSPSGYTGARNLLLTSDGKLYRYIGGAWVKTVDGNDLVAGSVIAGKIAAGAISATEIAAGAVTTGKLLVTGQGAALNADPNTSDISAWSSFTGAGTITVATVADGKVGPTVLRVDSTGTGSYGEVQSQLIPSAPQKTYRLQFWARKTSGAGVMYGRIQILNLAGSLSAFATGIEGQTVPSTWTKYRGTIVAPADAYQMKIVLTANYSTGAGVHEFQDVRLEEAADYDLIVDGGIIASKLAANSIAVGTLAVQNGALVNAMIGTAAIDDAKVANLSASKLSVGTGIIGGNLKSSNYVFGVSGWLVMPNGYAEFDAAVIRGTLLAAQIGAGQIDATKINVANLAAISANMGTLTSGTISTGSLVMTSGGNIRQGMSAYNVGVGFWLGDVGGTAKFAIGNPAANNMTWDGSVLTINGVLGATTGTFGGIVTGTLSTTALTVAGNSIFSPAYASANAAFTVTTGTTIWRDLGIVTASVNPGTTGCVSIAVQADWFGIPVFGGGGGAGGGDG